MCTQIARTGGRTDWRLPSSCSILRFHHADIEERLVQLNPAFSDAGVHAVDVQRNRRRREYPQPFIYVLLKLRIAE